jgi:hypothetical protein
VLSNSFSPLKGLCVQADRAHYSEVVQLHNTTVTYIWLSQTLVLLDETKPYKPCGHA